MCKFRSEFFHISIVLAQKFQDGALFTFEQTKINLLLGDEGGRNFLLDCLQVHAFLPELKKYFALHFQKYP